MVTNTRTRTDSAARWQKAAARAVAEDVQVRQLAGSGAWIAVSGTDATTAYALEITGAVAHGCECLAGQNADPVCKHRAAWYLSIGALSADPEPEPPAPAAITFTGNSDRQEVRINGKLYGDAVATEWGGWTLFRGRFPHARRVGSYCTLEEIARELAARLPVPFPQAETCAGQAAAA